MNWPWVSREQHEAELQFARLQRENDRASHERVRELLAAEIDRQREAFAALVDKFTALRLAGAQEPLPAAPVPIGAKPDPVNQAIIHRMRGRSSIGLRDHYLNYVRDQRALGIPDTEIAAAIEAGQEVDFTTQGVPA